MRTVSEVSELIGRIGLTIVAAQINMKATCIENSEMQQNIFTELIVVLKTIHFLRNFYPPEPKY